MKKSELRKMINEELKAVLKEDFQQEKMIKELRTAVMKVVDKYKKQIDSKQAKYGFRNLDAVIDHSVLNIVNYVTDQTYMA